MDILDTLKATFWMEKFNTKMDTIRTSFPKSGHFFWFSKKDTGSLPFSPSLVARLIYNYNYFPCLIGNIWYPTSFSNIDVIKRLSSGRQFSSKKLQEGASLGPYEKSPIKYCIATEIKTSKGQPRILCISVIFTEESKLGLHPQMLPSFA